MWTSLEVRAPFLDHRLVEFALSLPAHYHVGHTGKLLLKRAMRGLLPEVILDRPKMGFGMPLDRWFRTELLTFARDLLFGGQMAARGFLARHVVAEVLERHLSGRTNYGRQLWALVCFELWCQHYVDGQA